MAIGMNHIQLTRLLDVLLMAGHISKIYDPWKVPCLPFVCVFFLFSFACCLFHQLCSSLHFVFFSHLKHAGSQRLHFVSHLVLLPALIFCSVLSAFHFSCTQAASHFIWIISQHFLQCCQVSQAGLSRGDRLLFFFYCQCQGVPLQEEELDISVRVALNVFNVQNSFCMELSV